MGLLGEGTTIGVHAKHSHQEVHIETGLWHVWHAIVGTVLPETIP
jgi:hypothetical protein